MWKKVLVLALAVAAQGGALSAQEVAPPRRQDPAIGRCAVDAKDGFLYGTIVGVETSSATGERTYRIRNAQRPGATWSKKAKNVRVVECAAPQGRRGLKKGSR